MTDACEPTPAGLADAGMTDAAQLATIDDDLRNLIDGMRTAAGDRLACDIDPVKLRAIAADLEQLRPIDTPRRARFLAARLAHYGLHQHPTSGGD